MSEIVLVTSNAEFNKLKNWAYENQIYISNETSNNIFDKYWTKVSINSKYTDKNNNKKMTTTPTDLFVRFDAGIQ